MTVFASQTDYIIYHTTRNHHYTSKTYLFQLQMKTSYSLNTYIMYENQFIFILQPLRWSHKIIGNHNLF